MSHELCRECGGDGEVGMHRDGTPIVCRRCGGDGFEPSRVQQAAERDDDEPWGGGEHDPF